MNGKAKIDFLKQSKYIESIFNELPKIYQNALIIDFFDVADIYVNALKYDLKWIPICENVIEHTFKSRQGAINFAIEKAIILYNEKFKENEN
jgi:hypothetical protein